MKKYLFLLFTLTLILGCSREENTPDPEDNSTTGNATFYTQKNWGCGNISVTINGTTKLITSYFATDKPKCGDNGTATFTLPPGTYLYKSTCVSSGGTLSWEGTITVEKGICTLQEFIANGTDNTETNDVYIAGYEFSGTKIIAKYWKNGIETSLPSNHNYSYANSIFVSNNDIYVCGSEGNGPTTAKLWKNGVATNLTGTAGFAEAHSVYVTGNDVYVGGVTDGDNWDPAMIWKNGVGTYQTGGDLIQSVFVSGGNVYASGYGNNKAKVWKNGTPTIIGNANNTQDKFSIFVSGNDVYVAGEELNSSNILVAKIWKNGVATNLTDGTKSAFARSVVVSNNDVYVVGSEYIDGQDKAMLWKNGIATNLSQAPSVATSIVVSGNDVYIAGYEQGRNAYLLVKLWKNGVGTNITSGASHAYATSIFIKKK